MRIILARHGETDYNKNKKVQGHSDIPLNEEGIKQGKEAGKKITDYNIDVALAVLWGVLLILLDICWIILIMR